MGTDASWLFQKMTVLYLEDSPKIQNAFAGVVKIEDEDNRKPEIPSLRLGLTKSSAWRSATFDGQEHEIRFYLYNREGGSNWAKETASLIIERLHDADFPISGHALVDLQFEQSQTRYLEDIQCFQTLLDFKGLTVCD